MPKIILAIDSFKGCLTSQEVEECAAGEIRRLFPTCQTYSLPAADGGEGMLEALVHITKGHCITCPVHDPLMRPITARYGTTGDGLTAIIETAQASGLPLLSEAERNPMKTTTYGTGELIRHALHQGFRRFLIGIGGSATNDAGLGMLQALGATLHTEQGIKQTCGTGETMGHITHIDLSGMEKALGKAAFTVACDVENPFCGENGAAPIFAPQKGATPEQIRCLDNGMKHLTKIFIHATGTDVSSLPGAGAAGGLGGALHAFLHARLVPGAELLLDAAGFDPPTTACRSGHHRRRKGRCADPDGQTARRNIKTRHESGGSHPADCRTGYRHRRSAPCRVCRHPRRHPYRHVACRSHAS